MIDANRNLYYRFAKRCTSIKDYFRSKELQLFESGSIGQFFKYVNKKMHMRSGISEVVLPVGDLTRNPLEIANTFNKYFSSVFTIDDVDNTCILSRTSTEMPNTDFEPGIVYATLQGLKSSMSSGPDGIPIYFLKNAPHS